MENLLLEKQIESGIAERSIDFFPEELTNQAEGEEVYQNLLAELSAVNMQRWHLRENELEEYVEQGRLVNELRFRNYELDNVGIFETLIVPLEDIEKEEAFLSYIEEHQLPLMEEGLGSSRYLVEVLTALSGLIFFTFVVVLASSIIVYEKSHQTVLAGFPISAIQKVHSKLFVYFISLLALLLLGVGVAFFVSYLLAGIGNFIYPKIIYLNGSYEAISTSTYLIYLLAGLIVVAGVVLLLTILLNKLVPNAYATVFIAIGLYFTSDLFMILGWTHPALQLFTLFNIPGVLSGDVATEVGNSYIDFPFTIIILIIFMAVQWLFIYLIQKRTYIKKQRSEKVA